MKGKLFQEVVAFYVGHWEVEDVSHPGGHVDQFGAGHVALWDTGAER
ncbi:MAG TPA: hypothetical protein VK813_15165 [Edaphobacter sp.]|nr:hypothetical protein [Edaphobacter sp.]